MKNHQYFVYILASERNGTLYIGVTNNLLRRVWEHKNELIEGFSKQYKTHLLVWFAETNDINEALIKEKQLKAWKRIWKLRLIEEKNPEWKDLSKEFI